VRSAKEEVRELLEKLADDASFEDIQYHIYVREKLEHGLEDGAAGRVIDQAELERRMSKWLISSRSVVV
jgi:predicted transcriptional regulator